MTQKGASRTARVARLTPPGPWWYIAVCEPCRWSSGLSWKHKGWADDEARKHDAQAHPSPSGD